MICFILLRLSSVPLVELIPKVSTNDTKIIQSLQLQKLGVAQYKKAQASN